MRISTKNSVKLEGFSLTWLKPSDWYSPQGFVNNWFDIIQVSLNNIEKSVKCLKISKILTVGRSCPKLGGMILVRTDPDTGALVKTRHILTK